MNHIRDVTYKSTIKNSKLKLCDKSFIQRNFRLPEIEGDISDTKIEEY
jgi:hypothetical protein